jgi:hypothetical protein
MHVLAHDRPVVGDKHQQHQQGRGERTGRVIMNWQIQGITRTLSSLSRVNWCGESSKCPGPLPLEFTKTAHKRSLVERIFRRSMVELLNIRADLPFARMIGSPLHLVQDELCGIPPSPFCQRFA